MIDNVNHRAASEVLAAAPGRRSPTQRMLHVVCGAIETLLLWQERRRQRRELATLNDAMLKDIGVTRLEALDEWRKWPWRG